MKENIMQGKDLEYYGTKFLNPEQQINVKFTAKDISVRRLDNIRIYENI